MIGENETHTKHLLDPIGSVAGRSMFDPFVPDNFGIIRDKFPIER